LEAREMAGGGDGDVGAGVAICVWSIAQRGRWATAGVRDSDRGGLLYRQPDPDQQRSGLCLAAIIGGLDADGAIGGNYALRAAAHELNQPRCREACKVFSSSMARVMGPTPPGTGVIQAARSAALPNSTSPVSWPLPNRFMPTSTTVAPGLIQSPAMSPGLPTATIRMSACDT